MKITCFSVLDDVSRLKLEDIGSGGKAKTSSRSQDQT